MRVGDVGPDWEPARRGSDGRRWAIISAKVARRVGDGSYEDFLQIDAPINQGNSGGRFINLSGELVWAPSCRSCTPTGGNIGSGFAIPSNMAREVMGQLKAAAESERGKRGRRLERVTLHIVASLEAGRHERGAGQRRRAGSAASRAGLKQGDVITALNGDKVADSNALRNPHCWARAGLDDRPRDRPQREDGDRARDRRSSLEAVA